MAYCTVTKASYLTSFLLKAIQADLLGISLGLQFDMKAY